MYNVRVGTFVCKRNKKSADRKRERLKKRCNKTTVIEGQRGCKMQLFLPKSFQYFDLNLIFWDPFTKDVTRLIYILLK